MKSFTRFLLSASFMAMLLCSESRGQGEQPFTFTSPVAGDVLTVGSGWVIQWTTTLPNEYISIIFCKDGVETTWGYYHHWNNGTLGVEINSEATPPGDGYQLKIYYDQDPTKYAFSEVFSVEGGPEVLYTSYGSVFKLYRKGITEKPKVFITDETGKRKKTIKVLDFDNMSITCTLVTKVSPVLNKEDTTIYPYQIWIQEKKKNPELWCSFFYVAYPQFTSITYDGKDKITVEGNYFGTKKPVVYMKFLLMHSSKITIKKIAFKVLEYDMKKIVVYVKPGYIESLKAQDITQSNFYVKNPMCENWDFFEF